MTDPRKPSQERFVLDDAKGGPAGSPGGLPDLTVTRPSERKQVNIPREVLEPLERFAESAGYKLTGLAAEAIAIFLKLMADENARGDLMRSRTSNSLERLKIELDCHPGYIVRVSTAIGCRLMEEASDGQEGGSLFDDLAEQAEAQQRSVPDLVADYLRAALARQRKQGRAGRPGPKDAPEDA